MEQTRFLRVSRPFFAAAGLLLGIAFTSLSPIPAKAQGAAQACTPDVFRLCNQYIPDRGRIAACLRVNRRALSPACRVYFAGTKYVKRSRYAKRIKYRKGKARRGR